MISAQELLSWILSLDRVTTSTFLFSMGAIFLLLFLFYVTALCLKDYYEETRLPDVTQKAPIRRDSVLVMDSPEIASSPSISPVNKPLRTQSSGNLHRSKSPPPLSPRNVVTRTRAYSSPSPRPSSPFYKHSRLVNNAL
ncbi:hypothetical protein P9112_012559 [Eukaryota sp. TZLM1-RC]